MGNILCERERMYGREKGQSVRDVAVEGNGSGNVD